MPKITKKTIEKTEQKDGEKKEREAEWFDWSDEKLGGNDGKNRDEF